MEYTKFIKELIQYIPLLDKFLIDLPGTLFGGFTRWAISYVIENKPQEINEKVLNSMYKYLEFGDLDIKLCNNDNPDIKIVIALYNTIANSKGYIEYCGNDYTNKDSNIEPIIINENCRIKYGLYKIWIPYKEWYIKYDFLFLFTRAYHHNRDFTVNSFEFQILNNIERLTSNVNFNSALEDIRSHSIVPCFYEKGLIGLRKLYRMKRLYELGYHPTSKVFEYVEKLINEQESGDLNVGMFICVGDTSKPSIITNEHHIIHPTLFEVKCITKNIFMKDTVIQEILTK